MKGWRLILLAVCMVWNMSVAAFSSQQLVTDAKKQIGVTKYYDPAYTRLSYPMGDVPLIKGVCTDVVVRSLRQQGIDLQQKIHEDMRKHFKVYPNKWGLKAPDKNIDHRRVPNIALTASAGMRSQPRSLRALGLGTESQCVRSIPATIQRRHVARRIVCWTVGGPRKRLACRFRIGVMRWRAVSRSAARLVKLVGLSDRLGWVRCRR